MSENAINSFKETYGEATKQIEAEINNALSLVAPTFASSDKMKLEAQRFIAEGGKRFRPALSYVVAKSQGVDYLFPNLALEVFHKYILTHDDIVDRDKMRYGKPTVHAKLEQLVSRGAESQHFGNSLAIVAGDLMEAATYKIILNSKLADKTKIELCQLLPSAMDEVGWGWYDQFLMDYLPLSSNELSLERIEKSLVWVSGRYTVRLPILFGYTLAGKKMPKSLNDFADFAGLLFQTGDDILGIFGDPKQTGKSNYGDIAQGKKTVLIWLAYSKASSADKKFLLRQMGNKDITGLEVEKVRNIVVKTGALDESKKMMLRYSEKCFEYLEKAELNSELKSFLTGFTYYLQNRDS